MVQSTSPCPVTSPSWSIDRSRCVQSTQPYWFSDYGHPKKTFVMTVEQVGEVLALPDGTGELFPTWVHYIAIEAALAFFNFESAQLPYSDKYKLWECREEFAPTDMSLFLDYVVYSEPQLQDDVATLDWLENHFDYYRSIVVDFVLTMMFRLDHVCGRPSVEVFAHGGVSYVHLSA